MKLNEPVDFELAKLLKEKRFDINTDYFYNIDGELYKPIFNSSDIPAPTIAEVIDWLYEKHNIWIEVSREYTNGKHIYQYFIDKNNQEFGFDSPIETYKTAINYCLKNLL